MRSDHAVLICEVICACTHGDEELIDAHRGVDGDATAKKRLGLVLPHTAWGIVAEKFGKAFDSHSEGRTVGKVGCVKREAKTFHERQDLRAEQRGVETGGEV